MKRHKLLSGETIGLEDVEDLKADLEAGFARLKAAS